MQLSHAEAGVASNTGTALHHDIIPSTELLFDMLLSVLSENKRLLAIERARNAQLEEQLKIATSMWKPEGVTLQ